jgi:hypothetical protein
MFTHPDLMSIVAKQHLKELAEQASKHRLAAELRRGRRQRWPSLNRKADRTAAALDRKAALDREAARDRFAALDRKALKEREESKSDHRAAAGRLG